MPGIVNSDEDNKDDDFNWGIWAGSEGPSSHGATLLDTQLTACRVDLHQHLPLGPAVLLGQRRHHLLH